MNIFICIFAIFCCSYSGAQLEPLIQDNVAISGKIEVDINELHFRIYTRADSIHGVEVNLTDGRNVANVSSFDKNLKTIVYVHGWWGTIEVPATIMIKDALLNASDVNVLLLNWDQCANSLIYFISWGCVEGVGNYLGEFLQDVQKSYNYSLDNVTIVGHSLGAHIAGYAGKKTNGTLDVIVGLDPAGPLYFESAKESRLNENDARYVQAIHSGAGMLGVSYNVGHVDFWPNGGYFQPGCGLDVFNCPHVRSIYLYAESVLSGAFVARNCNSFQDYEGGKCNGTKSVMGGINCDKGARGNYYLDTNDKWPFGKGDVQKNYSQNIL